MAIFTFPFNSECISRRISLFPSDARGYENMNQRHNVNISNCKGATGMVNISGTADAAIGNQARLGVSLFRSVYARFIYPPHQLFKRCVYLLG